MDLILPTSPIFPALDFARIFQRSLLFDVLYYIKDVALKAERNFSTKISMKLVSHRFLPSQCEEDGKKYGEWQVEGSAKGPGEGKR
jgi:hypothetical protein